MFKKLLLLLCLLASPAWAAPPAILVLGDSLSAGYGVSPEEGWVALLEQRLSEQQYPFRVINASISGDTTQGGLARLPRALKIHQPAIVIIELGGNDGLRGFPLEVLRHNLAEMVRLSRDSGARVLLLGMRLPDNYGASYTEKFHGVYRELAAAQDLAWVNFFMHDVADVPGRMQADGIHPNQAGQPILLDNAWAALKPLLDQPMTATASAAGDPPR